MTPWPSHPGPRRSLRMLLLALIAAVAAAGTARAGASAAADPAPAPAHRDSLYSWTLTLASQTDSRGELRPCT